VAPALPNRATALSYFVLAWKEVKSNRVGYALGFLSCLVVVVVVALMVSILAHSPVVFTRLAEMERGEIDVELTAGSWTGHSFLNYTKLSHLLAGKGDAQVELAKASASGDGVDSLGFVDAERRDEFSQHTPRAVWSGSTVRFSSPKLCKQGLSFDVDGVPLRWAYSGDATDDSLVDDGARRCGAAAPIAADVDDDAASQVPSADALSKECFETLCNKTVSSSVFVIDSAREKAIGLGRGWTHGSVDAGHVYITRSLAKSLRVLSGDVIVMSIDMERALGTVWSTDIMGGGANRRRVFVPLTVAKVYEDADGKYDSETERVAVLEYSALMRWLGAYMDPGAGDDARRRAASLDLYEFAQRIVVNLPSPRFEEYSDSDLDVVQRRLVSFASTLLYRIGFDQVRVSLPILSELYSTLRWFSLFLGLILNIIIFILLFLSVLLIYSLLMVSVETRTFQMGIMRMVGMRRSELVQLLLVQALGYSVPSVALGLALAKLGGVAASYYFLSLTGIPIDASLTPSAVAMAAALGFGIPIVASIVPIASALSRNLHDSIDTRRAKTSATELVIERSEGTRVPMPVLIVGVGLIVFGFMIYYLLPLALLSSNLTILLNMFFLLLLMMLLGLVLLSLNAQHLIEKLVVYALLCVERAAVRVIVLKNLVAHRRRNRMTTVMYALSLGFIIFLYVSYDVQITSVIYQRQQSRGALLQLYIDGADDVYVGAALEAYGDASPYIDGYGWTTPLLEHTQPVINQASIGNIGRVYRYKNWLHAVTPNFFEVSLRGFLRADVYDADWLNGDLAQQLYTARGANRLLLGALYRHKLGLSDLDADLLIEESLSHADNDARSLAYFRAKPSGFLRSCPGFLFSQFPAFASQNALVSMTAMTRLTGVGSVDDVPLERFVIKLRTDDDDAIDRVKSDLRELARTELAGVKVGIYDYRDSLKPIEEANMAMLFFFGFTIVVAMLISFFSLMSSMLTNVREQAKEIGILRALGLPKLWLTRIYIYEAFTVVFSSSLLGIVIGTLVGWTISLQRVLFTSLPVPFNFPLVPLIIILLLSAVLAFVAAFSPITALMKKSIVSNMRVLM
jgi:ABC-type antimicrobial peptide transport system permease subunit